MVRVLNDSGAVILRLLNNLYKINIINLYKCDQKKYVNILYTAHTDAYEKDLHAVDISSVVGSNVTEKSPLLTKALTICQHISDNNIIWI